MAQNNSRPPSALGCGECGDGLEYERREVGTRAVCEKDALHDVGNRLADSGCPVCEKGKVASTIRATVVWGTALVCPVCEG